MATKSSRSIGKYKRHELLASAVYLVPALAFFLVFSVYPFFSGVALAFQDANVFVTRFVGLDNFREIIQSPLFWKGFYNTLRFTLWSTIPIVIIPFMISVFAASLSIRYQYFIRFAFFVPMFSGGIITMGFWKWFFHPRVGLANAILGTKIAWLGQNPYAFYACELVLISTMLGMPIIMYLSRLLNVDRQMYEAARIDGAGELRIALHLTLPELMPLVIFILITRTVGFLQVWQVPYTLTGGGPVYGTTTMVLQAYEATVIAGRWGYASAISMVLLILTGFIMIIQRRLLREYI